MKQAIIIATRMDIGALFEAPDVSMSAALVMMTSYCY
jgi:hypothetical protein